MSNEPARLSEEFAAAAQSPVAAPTSDVEKMRRALERMKVAVRGRPEVAEQLRAELEDMLATIANMRAALLADSDPSALLDDLESRTERMIAAIDPAMTTGATTVLSAGQAAALPVEAAALPAEHLAPPKKPALALPVHDEPTSEETALAFPAHEDPAPEETERPADEQAFLDAIGDEPVAEAIVETAAEPEPTPEPATASEPDRVPTVSGVISRLGLDQQDDAESYSVAQAGQATTVAMLESMVEELTASMPAPTSPEEIAEEIALREPEPVETATPPQSDLEETAEIAHVAPSEPETVAVVETSPEPA